MPWDSDSLWTVSARGDDVVPAKVKRWMALRGEPVAFRRYPVDHRGTLDAAAADGLAFVRARLGDAHFNEAAETAHLEQVLDESP